MTNNNNQYLQSADDTVQHRGLLFLHHTIKALASKRLTADRRAFTELTGQVTEHIALNNGDRNS